MSYQHTSFPVSIEDRHFDCYDMEGLLADLPKADCLPTILGKLESITTRFIMRKDSERALTYFIDLFKESFDKLDKEQFENTFLGLLIQELNRCNLTKEFFLNNDVIDICFKKECLEILYSYVSSTDVADHILNKIDKATNINAIISIFPIILTHHSYAFRWSCNLEYERNQTASLHYELLVHAQKHLSEHAFESVFLPEFINNLDQINLIRYIFQNPDIINLCSEHLCELFKDHPEKLDMLIRTELDEISQQNFNTFLYDIFFANIENKTIFESYRSSMEE